MSQPHHRKLAKQIVDTFREVMRVLPRDHDRLSLYRRAEQAIVETFELADLAELAGQPPADFLDRLKLEHLEIDMKLSKIERLMKDSNRWDQVSDEERPKIVRQSMLLEELAKVLSQRITMHEQIRSDSARPPSSETDPGETSYSLPG